MSSDPAIHCALAQAKSLDARGDLFTRLSLYEQRLTRTLTLAKAELKQLQQERAQARERALATAAQIRNLKEALDQPWQPDHAGFEFSDRDLSLWIDRRQLAEQARDYEFHGLLPNQEVETPEIENNNEELSGAGMGQ